MSENYEELAVKACKEAGFSAKSLQDGTLISILDALSCIVTNAEFGPDPSMNGATDAYHIPTDDYDTAKDILDHLNDTPSYGEFNYTESMNKFMDYMNGLDGTEAFADVTKDAFIHDIIYGLGRSISEDFKWADGYMKFKEYLMTCLEMQQR